MARAATTSDAFNAVAEPRRRQILDALEGGERSVTDLVEVLRLTQPQVSKHLRVLRDVGLVHVREDGRRRIYRIDPAPLAPIQAWVQRFEHDWEERFARLEAVVEGLERREGGRIDGDER